MSTDSRTKWTERYGDGHNKRRRERYQKDKAYREAIQAKAREYQREKNTNTRELNGVQYTVYSAGDIKKALGLTQGQFQWIQDRGYLPPSSFEGKHYRLTENQLNFLKETYEKHKSDYKQMATVLHDRWEQEL